MLVINLTQTKINYKLGLNWANLRFCLIRVVSDVEVNFRVPHVPRPLS